MSVSLRRHWLNRLLLLAGAYGAGLACYIMLLPAPFTTLPPGVEGLAVLTGGSGRVKAALRQVEKGFTGPVLISGAHPQTELADILALTARPLTARQQDQIMLDLAASTRENLHSVKVWAATTGLAEVGVITSTYHAARVRWLGWWQTPELKLHILPVQPPRTELRTLLREYHKLLLAPFLP